MSRDPIGFMSYVRFADQHESGRLTEFCTRLSGEVQLQTGEQFHIFQDRNDIAWGEEWQHRIKESLDAVTFLIPILTPGYFKSSPCRDEFERFLEREKKLARNDLILPVYYVDCPVLNDEVGREADPIAKIIARRNYVDWRELRFEPFTSPQVGKTIAKFAGHIVQAMTRGQRTAPPAHASALLTVPPPTVETGSATKPSSAEDVDHSAQVSSGPAPKSQPPTRIVDALHRGDHLTVTEALAFAKPGDRILIRPGLYKEGVVIDKPVEIIGDGELGEVVIEATGKSAVQFQATMGRVANLSLRQAGGGNWYCVSIGQGRLDLEACDITSRGIACVAIHSGADPRLRRNRIHDSSTTGVVVSDDGQGTLEDNDIFGNGFNGVEIRRGGNPIVRRNRIHGQKYSGVYVHSNGQGTVDDNDIFANLVAGVTVQTGGNPTVRRNRIVKNGYPAICINRGGRGVFEDNDLRGNTKGAWDIAADCLTNVVRKGNQE